jgi:hypothetical protein
MFRPRAQHDSLPRRNDKSDPWSRGRVGIRPEKEKGVKKEATLVPPCVSVGQLVVITIFMHGKDLLLERYYAENRCRS